MEEVSGIIIGGSRSSPVHRPALADLPLHHPLEEAATLTSEDENLLDELHDLARRLDDRICTIERIMTAENPNWRAVSLRPGGDRDRGPQPRQYETIRRKK